METVLEMELQSVKGCVINTGNILSLKEITRKSGLNPTEELIEAINITVKEFKSGASATPGQSDKVIIHRPSDDLKAKIEQQSLSDLKIGLKIFVNDDSKALIQAVEEGFNALKVPFVQNVILQYKKDKIIESGDDINSLKNIWAILEDYVKNEKIAQIGLADVEESTFRSVFEWATVKPAIIQINLATCCVVPPTLQAFCKDNDVQLLTHSDPSEILPTGAINGSLGVSLRVKWVSKFLVHIKCRGVLCSKGYLIGLGDL